MQEYEAGKIERKHDFMEIYNRFSHLDNGLQASLRRVARPDDLRETVAIYRLFPEARPEYQWLRVVFLLPWCEQCNKGHHKIAKRFGTLLAEAKVNESRLFEMVRADEPDDLIFLRRLARQVKPVLDWNQFGPVLYYWNQKNKRDIVEEFFYCSSTKATKEAP